MSSLRWLRNTHRTLVSAQTIGSGNGKGDWGPGSRGAIFFTRTIDRFRQFATIVPYMSLIVVGSVAYDGVETPHGKVDRMLGGAATYIALSAAYFTPVK